MGFIEGLRLAAVLTVKVIVLTVKAIFGLTRSVMGILKGGKAR